MNKVIAAIIFAVLFATAFYKSAMGINVPILDAALLIVLISTQSQFFKKMNGVKIMVLLFWLGSAVFVALYASSISKWVHFVFTAIFCGYVTSSFWVQPLWAFWSGFISMLTGLIHFRKVEIKTGKKRKKFNFKSLSIYVIPIAVVIVFLWLYAGASSTFAATLKQIADYISRIFDWFPNIFNLKFILLFVLGISIALGFLFPKLKALVLSADVHKSMDLQRHKETRNRFKALDLLKEYKGQLFMFIMLNLLLFMLNVDDILNVWMRGALNEELNVSLDLGMSYTSLKEFVHSGTYNLLISIVISVFLVLFAFRKNLNFYKSSWLKPAVYLFLAQNIFLTASVFVRNWHYVNYFNLAYLRIGLMFFLVFSVAVMILIYWMIAKKKTRYFLLKQSSFVAMILLFVMSGIDWDKFICKYNFEHADKAYVHRSWLLKRDEKCLPILQANRDILINGAEAKGHKYDLREDYGTRLDSKITNFQEEYQTRNFWEWNYADWKAYEQLSN